MSLMGNFVVASLQSQLYISSDGEVYSEGVVMEYQNRETCLLKKTSKQSDVEKDHNMSLREIPLRLGVKMQESHFSFSDMSDLHHHKELLIFLWKTRSTFSLC